MPYLLWRRIIPQHRAETLRSFQEIGPQIIRFIDPYTKWNIILLDMKKPVK